MLFFFTCRQILLKYGFEETIVFSVYVCIFPDSLSKLCVCVCVCIHLPTPELNMIETGLKSGGFTDSPMFKTPYSEW